MRKLKEIAKVDIFREVRKDIPEIILAEGKSIIDLRKIVLQALKSQNRVVVSRISFEQARALRSSLKIRELDVEFHGRAMVAVIRRYESQTIEKSGGKVGIIAAGTADIPIAEEAKIVAEEAGCQVLTAYDVGVAGIHRLFPVLKKMIEEKVDVLIVAAGMEGALPSVVSGLVNMPVIGLPTSTGYGFAGKGLGALITMLQTCSPGLSVVNIDNGVGAGATAAMIANRAVSKKYEKHS